MLHDAELLRGRVDGINVTDLQSSVMRLGSLAVCHLLKENGLEPIFQITCRDRNRLALQSDPAQRLSSRRSERAAAYRRPMPPWATIPRPSRSLTWIP